MMDIATLSAAAFAPHLNSVFTMTSDEGVEIAATLTACTENPKGTMPGSPRTAFSLILECPADGLPYFNGATFAIVHPVLGDIGQLHVERVMIPTAGSDTASFQIGFN